MPARDMLLYLTFLVGGLGMCLAGALLCSTGQAAHAVCGGIRFVPVAPTPASVGRSYLFSPSHFLLDASYLGAENRFHLPFPSLSL